MQMSRMIVAALLIGTFSVGLVSPALAERGPEGGGRPMFNFDDFDTDKDGKVTEAEIETSRAARVKAADANGDGLMSVEELAALHLAQMTERAKTMATEMVARMDSDGDGLLSAAEMAARPGPAGMFGRIDTDSDGAITRAEADAAMTRMADRRGGHMHRHGQDQSED